MWMETTRTTISTVTALPATRRSDSETPHPFPSSTDESFPPGVARDHQIRPGSTTPAMASKASSSVITSITIACASIPRGPLRPTPCCKSPSTINTPMRCISVTRWSIKEEGESRELEFRAELMTRKKEYLKSQVQTTMGVLEQTYRDAHDPGKLKSLYRELLQNAVNTAFGVLRAIEAEGGLDLDEKRM